MTQNELDCIITTMCDDYCRYPREWDEEAEGRELIDSGLCDKCPLNGLVKEVLRPKGKWIPKYIGKVVVLYQCDQCKWDNSSRSRFCPHCGTDMREVQDTHINIDKTIDRYEQTLEVLKDIDYEGNKIRMKSVTNGGDW